MFMKSHYDGQEIIDIKIFKFQEKYASVAVLKIFQIKLSYILNLNLYIKFIK